MADTMNMKREGLTQIEFDARFGRRVLEKSTVREMCCDGVRKHCKLTKPCCAGTLLGLMPIIHQFRIYNWRKWLASDILAGLSVGVVQIPQGMGFALLTGVPPVYGLYTAFWPVLVYALFGSSRHISMGAMAITSLLLAGPVETAASQFLLSSEAINTTTSAVNTSAVNTSELVMGLTNQELEVRVGTACMVTLMVGIIQIALGLLHLGFVTAFMPKPFISGFTTGAAFHIATSQIGGFLGIKVQRFSGIFKLPYTWRNIGENILGTNLATMTVGLVCLVILVLMKHVVYKKCRCKIKIQIPAELIVVVLGNMMSYLLKLSEKYDVSTVGHIPQGMTPPTLPPISHMTDYIADAIIIAVLGFVFSISMANIFSNKYRYVVDSNQEFLAYGLSNMVGAFFGCFAVAAAPPRCFVQDQAGGKTQLSSLVSCLFLLLVIFAIGYVFKDMPSSVLSAIILVAILPLFAQFTDPKGYWRINKIDSLLWIFTMLSVVFLNIELGLGIGILLSICSIAAQGIFAKGYVLGHVKPTGLYMPQKDYETALTQHDLCIFKYESNLYFASIKNFKESLFAATVDPLELHTHQAVKKSKVENKLSEISSDCEIHVEKGHCNEGFTEDIAFPNEVSEHINYNTSSALEAKGLDKPTLKAIVLDCSSFTYIDVMGVSLIQSLHADFKMVGIKLVLAKCSHRVLHGLHQGGVVHVIGNESNEDKLDATVPVYPSVHDAVLSLSQPSISQSDCDLSPDSAITRC